MKRKHSIVGIGALLFLIFAVLFFLLFRVQSGTGPAPLVSVNRSEALVGAVEPERGVATGENNPGSASGDLTAVADGASAEAAAGEGGNEKRPSGPGTLTGLVTMQGDGAPVAGADILLDYIERPHDYAPYPEARMQWKAASDDRGAFRIGALPVDDHSGRQGRLVVIASKGKASAVLSVNLDLEHSHALVELELRPSGAISGQVVDMEGSPISGAIVVPHRMSDKAQEMYSADTRELWAATDQDGLFELEHLNAGAWALAVHAAHFADSVSKPFSTGETRASIVLTRGASVSGTVRHAGDGQALAGIAITCNGQGSAGSQQRVLTDQKGAFQVDSLAGGEYIIGLDDERMVQAGEVPRFLISGEEPVEGIVVTATEGGSISGKVIDSESSGPVEGIEILAVGNQKFEFRTLKGISDASGVYRITGLPGGTYMLSRGRQIGYLHGESRENKTVSLALGEVAEHVDFVVHRGVALSGKVVDSSGEPLEGLNVSLDPMLEDGEVEQVTSTEDGSFRLNGLSPNIDAYIVVAGRGYTAPRVGPVNTGDSGMDGIKIIAEIGASVAGIVVDAGGKPVPDVAVSASSLSSGLSKMESTGTGGKFLFTGLVEDSYRLQAHRRSSWSENPANAQEVSLGKGEARTDLRLVFDESAESITSGVVTNAKMEPIADVTVQAYSLSGSNAYIETGADGTYELNLDLGLAYTMNVHHEAYTTQEREIVAAGEHDVNFVLEGLGTVEGQVLDAVTGKPIASFEVAQSPSMIDSGSAGAASYIAIYSEEGLFSINQVEAGDVTIFARAPGYSTTLQHVSNVQAGEVTGGIQLRLHPGASIEGVVLDARRAPVQGAQIYVSGGTINSDEAAATSDVEGRFTVGSLAEGLARIAATHPKYSSAALDATLVYGQSLRVEIIMTDGGTVEGTVSTNGVPAAEQTVSIEDTATGPSHYTTTDKNGFYTISQIVPGDVTVVASVTRNGMNRSLSKSAVAVAGATTTVNLDVNISTGSFEGSVTLGGQNVSEGFAFAILQDSEGNRIQEVTATISPDGAYALSGLAAGDYRLVVKVPEPGSGRIISHILYASLQEGETVTMNIDVEDGAHVRGMLTGAIDTGRCQVVAVTGTIQASPSTIVAMLPEFQGRAAGNSLVDASGAYDIGGLPAGDYTLVAVESGRDESENINIASGQITVENSEVGELNLGF